MTSAEPHIAVGDIAARLDIGPGDTVLVSSDVLRLALACRERGERFDADVFIDSLQARIGATGTLLFPTYSWAFCKGEGFDAKKTPSLMGALTSQALRRPDFRRTRHPLYSFAVWGAGQQDLCALDNRDSWSEDSPFGYLYRRNAKNLFAGIHYRQAFTFDHYAEQKVGVPYRYFKSFFGPYTDENGTTTSRAEYTMYVRDLSLGIGTFVRPELDDVLAQAGLYQEQTINGVYFGQIALHGACDIMEQDIRDGGGLIYTAPEP